MNTQAVNAVLSVDRAFLFIFGVSLVILLLIAAATVYFAIRYNKKRHPVPADFDHNIWAELIWIAVPTILVLAMFYYGWQSFRALRGIPAEAMEVKVVAKMWSWSFIYDDGRASPRLVVPVGRPVKLSLTSLDVIHGFYAPAFRVKIDVVPGMTTYAWLMADQPGDYEIFCTVYCGLGHARMLSKVHAVGPEEFARWREAEPTASGPALLDKYGCLGCHSLDGGESVGPTLKDILGHRVALVAPDGKESTATVDRAYLREAILGTKSGTVKGFDPVMPNFEGQISPEELQTLVDFLAGGPETASPEAGAKLAEDQGCLGCHSTDGSPLVGPSFKGLFGHHTTVLDQGQPVRVVVDREFLKEVLDDPSKRPTQGYDPVMPPFPQLTPAEVEALAVYLESLAGPAMEHKP